MNRRDPLFALLTMSFFNGSQNIVTKYPNRRLHTDNETALVWELVNYTYLSCKNLFLFTCTVNCLK